MKFNGKNLRFEFRELLLDKLMDVRPITAKPPSSKISISSIGNGSRRYEQQLAELTSAYIISYNGRKLAEIYRRPHKKIILFEQFDSYRLPSKMLERTALDYIPAIKTEWRTGE